VGPRVLSYTEIETALTCWARHDFAYGGRLTGGDTLKPKKLAPILSQGRAWGAAVAAFHQGQGTLLAAWNAHAALNESLLADTRDARERGFDTDFVAEEASRLGRILDHYIATTVPLDNLTRLEEEILVPVPTVGGKRGSTKYKFVAYIDGWTTTRDGQEWIVEFKLRQGLQDPDLMQKARQYPWYAWAKGRQSTSKPLGVLVDERLNDFPHPARLVKGKKKTDPPFTVSHAKDQVTTPDVYLAACLEHGVDPDPYTVAHLDRREWQHRVPLMFRPSELETAGNEIRDAAKLIGMLDRGELTPIRNAARSRCRGCKFSRICANPTDHLLVDMLYERTVPKRLRPPGERK
jgi:hypothetical protein